MRPAIFKRLLTPETTPVHYILSAFDELNHVAYLYNNGQPFIAIHAEQYWLNDQHSSSVYTQQNFNKYAPSNSPFDIKFDSKISVESGSFQGGYVGFIGYDYGAQQTINCKLKPQPALFIGKFNSYIRLTSEGWMFESHSDQAEDLFNHLQNLLKNAQSEQSFELTQPCKARWSKTEYAYAFEHIQDYIKAGDCYQINLTQEFIGEAQGSLIATAEKFWELTNAPYAGYVRVGDFELLSCSPELFIDFKAGRKIITKPIKGTMPRYADPVLDEQSKQTLIHSEKDMAENVMIVDLLRNDLSVYAETGTVKTPKLFNIESFNQVHHMVSEVEAVLKSDVNPFDVLLFALPGGSITGAPKIRAMQIIEELEDSPRGAYCGSMGYFNHDGTGSWNILIRSIQKYQDQVSLWAGGGITIASNCDAEYQECFDKVEAMLDLLNTWHTPE